MELPSVFANKIDKKFDNNDMVYSDSLRDKNNRDVRELIRYFDRKGYSDRLRVKLYYRDNNSSIEKLVLYKGDYFVNIDNKKIYLNDVVNFEIQ